MSATVPSGHMFGENTRRAVAAERGIDPEDALTLLAYLVSSADISRHEPRLYPSFRLLDAAGRLAAMIGTCLDDKTGGPWSDLSVEIETKKGWMMWDRAGFEGFVSNLPARVVLGLERLPNEPAASTTAEAGQ